MSDRPIVLAGTLAPGASGGDEPAAVEWLLDGPAGVVELRLVHDEQRRADGGVLRVDPSRRLVRWEGIPGERGCRQSLEVPFGSVRSVRDEPQGEIRLEIKGHPRDRWLFVPLPHAAWVARASSAVQAGLSSSPRFILTCAQCAGDEARSSRRRLYTLAKRRLWPT